MPPKTPLQTLGAVDSLLRLVYGDWTLPDSGFPKPMPADEAGLGRNGQRRYLWTDAFAATTFVSQAMLARELGAQAPVAQSYLDAASLLIRAVHETLGNPANVPMSPDPSGGFLGLRIGKVMERQESDYGMRFDGQYWHYEDKQLFALYRCNKTSGKSMDDAIKLAKGLHSKFFVPGRGYHWKLNADLRPIQGSSLPRPNHDALSAYIVYNLLNADGALNGEITLLRPIVASYLSTPPSQLASDAIDPLGLGTHMLTLQFLDPNNPKVQSYRSAILSVAPRVLRSSLSESSPGDMLNFRLYGALLGLQLPCSTAELSDRAREAAWGFLKGEVEREEGEHSTINRVMLAAALNPRAFEKLDGDPVVGF